VIFNQLPLAKRFRFGFRFRFRPHTRDETRRDESECLIKIDLISLTLFSSSFVFDSKSESLWNWDWDWNQSRIVRHATRMAEMTEMTDSWSLREPIICPIVSISHFDWYFCWNRYNPWLLVSLRMEHRAN